MGMNRSGVLNGPLDIRVEPRESPSPDADGIVVEVSVCGICGSDMHMWRHPPTEAPRVLGHEFSGRVHAVGSEVSDIPLGARVTANPMHSFIGVGGVPGAFADYVHVPRAEVGKTVFLLPPEISDEEGALIEPLAVAMHAIKRADPKPGDKVLITGAGPIGLCVLAALRTIGVVDVALSDVEGLRLSIARELGAAACLNPRDGEVVGPLREQFGESVIPYCPPAAAIDIVFECAGVPQAFETAVRSVRFGGKIVYVASGPPVSLDPNDMLFRELSILGSYSYVDEFHDAIALVKSGKVDLRPLVTQRFPLESLPEAFAAQADASKSVKTMVVVRDRAAAL